MLETRDAYKILGVREGASKAEIQKKYDVILKKVRMAGTNGQTQGNAVNIDELTRAYNVLMGYEEISPLDNKVAKAPNPLLKKLGIDEKKLGNFLHYHKYHILVSIVALACMISILQSCLFNVPADLKLAFIGEIYYEETDTLDSNIKSALEHIQKVEFDSAIEYKGMDGQYEVAMAQKKMLLFAAGDIDVFVVDSANFFAYAEQGAFISLDELAETLEISIDENEDYITKAEDDEKKHLYGIDVSESSFLKDAGIIGDNMIAAIGVVNKHYDNAVELLKTLVK